MPVVLQYASRCFDACHTWFDGIHGWFGRSLALVFVLSLLAIQANALGYIPEPAASLLPVNLFQAVHIVFTLVLVVEVVEMVFVLPKSFTRAVGKQFEIFCLILLRHAFNELVHFSDVLTLSDHVDPVLRIMADGFGALVIFLFMGIFFALRRPLQRFRDLSFLEGFVATKKLLALILLGFFLGTGIYNACAFLCGKPSLPFFSSCYTALVFADIFIVLVSQQYFTFFPSIFRNVGLAVSTTLLRIGLSAPAYFDVLLGIVAILFAVGIQLACYFWIKYVDQGKDERDMVREA